MDIKEQVEKLVKQITGDSKLLENFKKNPVETLKSLVGNIPEDQLKSIVEAVKAKINIDAVKDVIDKVDDGKDAGGVSNLLKGLFKKKK